MTRDLPSNLEAADDAHTGLLPRLEVGLLVLLMGTLMGLAFAQILLRNLFAVTWLWADPLIRHLVLWTSLLGALLATRDNRHIRIDALLRLLPGGKGEILATVGDAIAAATCFVLTAPAVRFVIDEASFGGDAFLDVPRWIAQLIFPLVFGGMGLRFCGRAVCRVRSLADTSGRG
ncbi:MAG: TRAP transporter small permease [bacterium]|nr:TRAP transporter small permease [bacterium]